MARYDTRFGTRITRDANKRIRLAALVLNKPLSHVLTEVIDKALPTADELAEQLKDDAALEVAS